MTRNAPWRLFPACYGKWFVLNLKHQNVLRDTIPHEVVKANVIHNVPIIKAWREYLGMTQEQLAEKVNMKQSALARLESGSGKPRDATLIKLATAFGVKPELLEE